MKPLRIIALALILTWFSAQELYIAITHYFINGEIFAFLSGFEKGTGYTLLIPLTFLFSVWFISFCLSLTATVFLYDPLVIVVRQSWKYFYHIKK